MMDAAIRYPPYTPFKVNSMLFLQRTSINFKKIIFFSLIVLVPYLIHKYVDFKFNWKK
jgi:hypothetical protein